VAGTANRAVELGPYWSRPADGLLAALGTSTGGLSSGDALRRMAKYGRNTLQVRKKATAPAFFLNQFKSPIMLILLFATGVSAALGDWADALIILAIVAGSAVLSFVQEYGANNAAERLRARLTLKANVVRDGRPTMIPAEDLVPGDVVLLSAGSLIPADGVLLGARDFFVNQAVLTGETFPVEKQAAPVAEHASLTDRTNCVFMGTNARSGTAQALVVQTGTATAFGQIAHRLTLRPPETEFERGIRRLGYLLSEVMFVLVLAVFAANVYFARPALDSLLFSIALAVGLTPQLLPAIININLSHGSRTMAGAGVIVRRLASIENFGSMDVLCTDKTGTLTEGVVRLDGAVDAQGQPSDAVLRYACLNAHFQTGLANPLDEAILAHDHPDLNGFVKVDEIPYDFVRKRLSVVVQEAGKGPAASHVLITKGALDGVLAVCSQLQENQSAAALDGARRAGLQSRYAEWSRQGYRVLGLATRSGQVQPAYTRTDEHDLTFVGFLLFFDPPKPGVRETIADLARVGVGLKIITGDNELVARHTAEAVGMPLTGVLTGAQLDDMHEEALWRAAEGANLFAAIDPNQKERLILALRRTGHVVGYMGDGINDAPALHAANVSISVDTAVDVAKEAADFVLLKHDLAVLHGGIVLGRRTFANTLKYVFMATSANFGNMFSVAGFSLFLPFLPMLPKQILLLNFLTDLPEMTIAGDNVDQVSLEGPLRWNIALIRRFMLVFGPLSSFFDYATVGVLLGLLGATPGLFRTGWFVESLLSAGLVVFVLRTRLPFFRSRPSRTMLGVTALVMMITVLIPYSPIAGVLNFQALPPLYLLAMVPIVGCYFGSAELAKRWFYRSLQRS